eukprot:gene24697-10330_t
MLARDDPQYWYGVLSMLPASDHAEWFIDCHRLRENDMNSQGNPFFESGLYVELEELNGASVIWAFLLYCKLAIR